MSEEDIRGWLNVLSQQLRELDKKTEALRIEVQAKSSEAHARLHSRINDVEDTVQAVQCTLTKLEPLINLAAVIAELDKRLTQIEPIVEAAKHHMETDVPVDAARDKAIAKSVLYVLGLTVSCFIGWLFSHFGGGK